VVTDAELQAFLKAHPILYHMAESGSWPSIQTHGLLSTTALLDLYGYEGAERVAIEAERRSNNVRIDHSIYGTAIVRDQKPMNDAALNRCLQDGLQPPDWYRLLNQRVFFWVTEERLIRLLSARPYAGISHDVLLVDTRTVVERYHDSITLAPINTGSTVYKPQPRGLDTFKSIRDYPYAQWLSKRRGREPVVELAVMGGISDIIEFTHRVDQRQGTTVIRTIWSRAGV
jgi:hypothetical protein